MKEKRKRFIQVFAIALIMLLIASASYAYFAAQYGEASSTDITVNTSTVDNLTFETGDAISISATQSNFTEGSGNQTDDTYASATLVANDDTNEASANYYLYIKIDTNEFEYTTSDKTAELILSITDPDGYEVTSLSGLTYTYVTDGNGETVSGFDITTKTGLITVTSEYLIESTGINTQEWNIEVTLVNLDSDQSDNAGASLSASIFIQSEVYCYNILQAVGSYSYSEKIWAYKSSITSIVFDDSGLAIDEYEEVYDVTDYSDPYCSYDGNVVSSFSGNTITESDCSNVYKVTDTVYSADYVEYYSDELMNMYLYNEPVSVSWDSESSTCVIDSLSGVTYYLYTWYNQIPTESECTGVAYQWQDGSYYYLGFESVGSGEWIGSSSSVYAYLVSNGDSTYTVYIESDLPIYGNEDMSYWFNNFKSLESIEGLDKLITSNVTTMRSMFSDCGSLTSLDLSRFDTSNATDMQYMFSGCSGLTTLDLSSFDTSKVTSMFDMFYLCSSLTTLDLSSFDTSNVVYMTDMFYGCSSLISLNFSSADFSNVRGYSSMFSGNNSSITVTVKDSDAYDFITARLSEYNGGTVVIA